MKNTYEKPVVEVNNCAAEGIYAASGTKRYALCHSGAMEYFQESNINATTYKEYYGCSGCPQWRGSTEGFPYNHCSFEETADFDQADQAGSYDTAANMPRWEREGYAANATVENMSLW